MTDRHDIDPTVTNAVAGNAIRHRLAGREINAQNALRELNIDELRAVAQACAYVSGACSELIQEAGYSPRPRSTR